MAIRSLGKFEFQLKLGVDHLASDSEVDGLSWGNDLSPGQKNSLHYGLDFFEIDDVFYC